MIGHPALGGYQAAVVKDLSRKVREDVQAAVMRTATLIDNPNAMMPVMLGGLQGVLDCVAALSVIQLEKKNRVTRDEARRVALEFVILQMDVFTGTSKDVAMARLRSRLEANGLGRLGEMIRVELLGAL
jgi:hypothetical protein